jgi:NAD(P)-dependent dehydrogenase (short-subunit alcohol dehydrogenase family)
VRVLITGCSSGFGRGAAVELTEPATFEATMRETLELDW